MYAFGTVTSRENGLRMRSLYEKFLLQGKFLCYDDYPINFTKCPQMTEPVVVNITADTREVVKLIDAEKAAVGMFNYQAECQQTKSDQYHGELVTKQAFINIIVHAIKALQDLDKVKKALFYGRKSDGLTFQGFGHEDCNALRLLNLAENKQDQLDILHSIIGKATESGESLEALFDAVVFNKTFDKVNFAEEIGDGLWYDAIGLQAIGGTFAAVQQTNIEKLRKRFPNKFTEYDANNRDLMAERVILERKQNAFDTLPDDYEVN